MSPAARLFLLLVVVVALPFLPLLAFVFVALGISTAVAFARQPVRIRVLDAVHRIRWLLLAVAGVIIVLTPGQWTSGRLVEAAWRCGVLVGAVASVQLALSGLASDALADGLSRLLRPLRWTHLPVDAFARRLTLTLDAVPRVQALIAATPAPSHGRFVDRVAGRAAAVIQALE